MNYRSVYNDNNFLHSKLCKTHNWLKIQNLLLCLSTDDIKITQLGSWNGPLIQKLQ